MNLCWTADLPDLFQASVTLEEGCRCYLLVEMLPFGGWEWLAWGQGGWPSLRGETRDRASAMRAAEMAIVLLQGVHPGRQARRHETLTLN